MRGALPKRCGEFVGDFGQVIGISGIPHQVDRAAAEAAAHHPRAEHAAVAVSEIRQKIEFLAAHFVPFAQSVVRTVHFFAESRVVPFSSASQASSTRWFSLMTKLQRR